MTESLPMTFTEPLSATESAKMQGWDRDRVASGSLSQAAFDAAWTQAPTTPPSVPSPPASPPVNTAPITAASIAQQLQSKSITPMQAGTLARAAGLDMLEIAKTHSVLTTPVEAKPPETQNPEIQLLNRDFPPAAPHEFNLDWGDAVDMHREEVQALDTSVRGWMAGVEFDRELGTSFAKAIDRAGHRTKALTPEQLIAYRTTEHANLVRIFGDQYLVKRERADAMLAEVEENGHPGLDQFMQAHKYIFQDAMVQKMLIEQSDKYWKRRSK